MMTKSQRKAIEATVAKLVDLARNGRGSKHFKRFGNVDSCRLCTQVDHVCSKCAVFGDPHVEEEEVPCTIYRPPGRRIPFYRIARFCIHGNNSMSIRTFKAWCLAAACDLRARFLEGK